MGENYFSLVFDLDIVTILSTTIQSIAFTLECGGVGSAVPNVKLQGGDFLK